MAKARTPEVEARKEARLEMVSGQGATWLNLEKPTRKEVEYLGQFYPFHPMDLDDCVSRIQLPKLDEYTDYLFIILHFPVYIKRARITTASQLAIFLGKDFLVTVHSGDLKPLGSLFRGCQEKEETCREYLDRDPGYLLYRILDSLVDYCFPMLDKTMEKLEALEDKVFDEKVDAAQSVAVLRRDIATQRRILGPLKAVMAEMEQRAQRFTKVDLKVYFGDIGDHLNRLWSNLEEAKETAEIFKDTDFVLSADRTNRVMTILTVLIAIMLPFSVVSGIYGMNLHLPGQEQEWFFPAVLSFMIAATGVMLLFFRRRGWI